MHYSSMRTREMCHGAKTLLNWQNFSIFFQIFIFFEFPYNSNRLQNHFFKNFFLKFFKFPFDIWNFIFFWKSSIFLKGWCETSFFKPREANYGCEPIVFGERVRGPVVTVWKEPFVREPSCIKEEQFWQVKENPRLKKLHFKLFMFFLLR